MLCHSAAEREEHGVESKEANSYYWCREVIETSCQPWSRDEVGQRSRAGQGDTGRQKANNVNSGCNSVVAWSYGYHLAQCAIAHISVYFLCWLQKRLVPLWVRKPNFKLWVGKQLFRGGGWQIPRWAHPKLLEVWCRGPVSHHRNTCSAVW